MSIVTKNALIQRDLDILKELASMNLVVVTISITSLNHDLIRKMEPRTSIPAKRLETVKVLSENGIPVGVNACPIIPGLNDVEIASILEESANRGARSANYTIVRLPHVVKDLFVEWVQRELPDRAPAILNRIRDIRGGNLSCSDFGVRLNGEGQMAGTIEQLFQSSCRRNHLNESKFIFSTDRFRRTHSHQPELF